MLRIKTANGHECFIEDDDLKHYVNAEVLATDVEVPTDAVSGAEGEEE